MQPLLNESVNHLFEAILCLENAEECYSFFEDICTVNELLSLSQRYEVACMLRKDLSRGIFIRKRTGNFFRKGRDEKV